MYFRQIFLSACLTAVIASIIFSLYQFYFVSPLIFAAEIYEVAEPMNTEQVEPWAPEDGIERSFFTWLIF
jgi:predicted cobalt transporter CbtA